MSWISTFYLVCFVVGFVLTIFFLALGHLNLHFHFHSLDGMHHFFGHGGPAVPHAVHGGSSLDGAEISPINVSTIMAFLTWFGGMGYLLTRYYRLWMVVGLSLATLAGLVGAGVVFVFMAKVLAPRQTQMNPEDYDLVGTLARISIPIHDKGTGEIIFSMGGTRRTSGARSVQGTSIEKNSEVVIAKYEHGIAYVEPWEEFSRENK